MSVLVPPWRRRLSATDGGPVVLDRSNPLNRNAVFSFNGWSGVDCVALVTATNTGVTRATGQPGPAWTFAGGAEGASDLNFGQLAATQDLHEQPATWAFLALSSTISLTALACHTDANNDRGWSIGYHADGTGLSVSGMGISLVRADANLRAVIADAPQVNQPYSFVVTYDGGALFAGAQIYLNGSQRATTGTDPVGTTGTATAESLYLGRRRYDTTLSHSGHIYVAHIANRVWTDAEVKAFHDNPWQLYEPTASPIRYFLPKAPGGAAHTLSVTVGTFAETGNAAGLIHGRTMPATVGTFALTGNAANLVHGRTMPATVGAFTLTGNATALSAQRKLAPSVATFALTGNATGLAAQRRLALSVATFTLTGNAAGLTAQRKLAPAVATFALTGNAATLTYAPVSGSHFLVCDTAAFALTGNAVGLIYAPAHGVTRWREGARSRTRSRL